VEDLLGQLRDACAQVARSARHVRLDAEAIPGYAATLPLGPPPFGQDPEAHLIDGDRELLAAFWLTLDAVNFGSGWFPTLRKRAGRSGYYTIAGAIRDRFASAGSWSAAELGRIDAETIARVLDQDAGRELMSCSRAPCVTSETMSRASTAAALPRSPTQRPDRP